MCIVKKLLPTKRLLAIKRKLCRLKWHYIPENKGKMWRLYFWWWCFVLHVLLHYRELNFTESNLAWPSMSFINSTKHHANLFRQNAARQHSLTVLFWFNSIRSSSQYLEAYTKSNKGVTSPDSKVHGDNMGPFCCRQAPCWPRELCYQGASPRVGVFHIFFSSSSVLKEAPGV